MKKNYKLPHIWYFLTETSGSGCWAPPNSTWLNECNTCTCVQGIQRCSNLWCGLQDCLGVNSTKCAPHEVILLFLFHHGLTINTIHPANVNKSVK